MNQDASKPTNNETQGETEQPQSFPPSPLKSVEPAAKGPDGGSGKNQSTDKQKSSWPVRVEACCAFLLVIITAFYTHYASQQADAAIKAAAAAKGAADTAADTLRQSVQQFRLEQRPWIEIELGEPVLRSAADNKFPALYKYQFSIKNTGKTTAFDIACRVPRQGYYSGEFFGDHPDWMINGQTMLLNEVPFAGASETDKIVILSKRMPQTLGPSTTSLTKLDLFGQEPKNGMFNYLIGRIDYSDAFMEKHWTTFCLFVDMGGSLRYCLAGNNQDRNYNAPPNPKR
jgi:hypothetical protein